MADRRVTRPGLVTDGAEVGLRALEQRLQQLEEQVRALQSGMRLGVTGRELLSRGALVLPLETAARSETSGVPEGASHAYWSGTSVFLGVFSSDAGGWKYEELT